MGRQCRHSYGHRPGRLPQNLRPRRSPCTQCAASQRVDNYRRCLEPGCSVLPVTLISFTAKPISGNTVEIKWETAQETQNERFVVERSKDLAAFETVAEI